MDWLTLCHKAISFLLNKEHIDLILSYMQLIAVAKRLVKRDKKEKAPERNSETNSKSEPPDPQA